jgi:hypothetical protein
VVLLAREPQALVLTHLAWHLALGAAEVHLFLDDPTDPVAPLASALPRVRVTRCDAAFWAAHPTGRRPDRVTARQSFCATRAYGRAGVGWLLHLDADEFLHPQADLAQELARNAALPGALVVPVRERAYATPDPQALFEGVFRIPRRAADPAHPLLAPLAEMAPRGVIGHALGKSITRTGLPLTLHPHFPRPLGGGAPQDVPSRPCTAAVLLHFDGLTPRHWLAKQRARLGDPRPEAWLGPHRQAQLRALAACGGDAAAERALHDRLRVLPDPAAWIAAGLAEARAFDPAPACKAVLGAVPDLTVAGFDAGLGG